MTKKERQITKRVQRALAALGHTSDQIAATLRRRRIKGESSAYSKCPIAIAMQRALHCRPGRVHVYSSTLTVLGRGASGEHRDLIAQARQDINIKMPRAVREFILRFDNKQFPELRR